MILASFFIDFSKDVKETVEVHYSLIESLETIKLLTRHSLEYSVEAQDVVSLFLIGPPGFPITMIGLYVLW